MVLATATSFLFILKASYQHFSKCKNSTVNLTGIVQLLYYTARASHQRVTMIQPQ